MSERKACMLLFFAGLLFSLFLGVVHPEESWFLVNSTELSKLESLWKTSEANRTSWESQARSLKIEAQELHTVSANLNRLLDEEQKEVRSLQRSFEAFVQDQSRIHSSKNILLADYEKEAKRLRKNLFRLVIINIALLGLIVVRLFLLIRKVFSIP